MYNPYSLDGKTILITGAASGIGRCTSMECSKNGARLVLVDLNEEGLKATLGLLEGVKEHLLYSGNLCDEAFLQQLAADTP